MKIISVKIPKSYLEDIDRLVKEGYYASRSEFIRTALRVLLEREYGKRTRSIEDIEYKDDQERFYADSKITLSPGPHVSSKRVIVSL